MYQQLGWLLLSALIGLCSCSTDADGTIHMDASDGGVSKEHKLKVIDLEKVPDSECLVRSGEGDWIEWHYIGTLLDGTEFHRGMFSATLGAGQVITGVDKGMRGLCKGDRRKLIIHSDWAYGDNGRPPTIPGKSTLIFVVDVKNVNHAKKEL